MDRSIGSPETLHSHNVVAPRPSSMWRDKHGVRRFLQVSTELKFTAPRGENWALHRRITHPTSSPYSASRHRPISRLACHHTMYVRSRGTRCSNITAGISTREVDPIDDHQRRSRPAASVYGDGLNVRERIHVEDHCAATWSALLQGKAERVYNVGSMVRCVNIDVVKMILDAWASRTPDTPGGGSPWARSPVRDRHARRIVNSAGKRFGTITSKGFARRLMWYVEQSRMVAAADAQVTGAHGNRREWGRLGRRSCEWERCAGESITASPAPIWICAIARSPGYNWRDRLRRAVN